MYLFAIKLHLLPIMGMRTIGVESAVDVLKHGILPCAVLALDFWPVTYDTSALVRLDS